VLNVLHGHNVCDVLGMHVFGLMILRFHHNDFFLMNDGGKSFDNSFVGVGVDGFNYFFGENFGLNSFDNFFVVVMNNRLFDSFMNDDGLNFFNNSGIIFMNSILLKNSFISMNWCKVLNVVNWVINVDGLCDSIVVNNCFFNNFSVVMDDLSIAVASVG